MSKDRQKMLKTITVIMLFLLVILLICPLSYGGEVGVRITIGTVIHATSTKLVASNIYVVTQMGADSLTYIAR